MKHKALFILVLFCGLLAVQSACAAGISLHCLHESGPEHQDGSCSGDKCRDEFSLPSLWDGLAKINHLATSVPKLHPLNCTDTSISFEFMSPLLNTVQAQASDCFPLLI